MIEERLARATEYTDELLIECIEGEGDCGRILSSLVRVCAGMVKKGGSADKNGIKTVVGYLGLLMSNPETFGLSGDKWENGQVVIREVRKVGVETLSMIVTYLPPESLEESLEVLLRSLGGGWSGVGLVAMSISQADLKLLNVIVERPEGLALFGERRIWGLEMGEGETSLGVGWPEKCVFAGFMNTFPSYVDLELQPGYMGSVAKDFLEKTSAVEKERLVSALQNRIMGLGNGLFVILRAIILRNTVAKQLFIEWIMRVYETSKNRRKSQFERRECISDGYAFFISLILAKFLEPISQGLIPGPTLRLDVLRRSSFINCQEMSSTTGLLTPKAPSVIEDTFRAKLLYAKFLMNQLTYIPLCAQFKDYQKEVESLTRQDVPATHPRTRLAIQRYISLFNSALDYHKVILSSPEIVALEIGIANGMMNFLKRAMSTPEFAEIPVVFVEDLILLVSGFVHPALDPARTAGTVFVEENVATIVGFCAATLAHPQININYKQLAVHLLHTFSQTIRSFIPSLLISLINYHIDLQKVIKNNMERTQERGGLALLLSHLLKNAVYASEMAKFLGASSPGQPLHTDKRTMFLLHTISSLVDAQERGFEELKKTSMTETALDNAVEEEKKDLQIALDTSIENARAFFANTTYLETFLHQLLLLSPRSFLIPVVTSRLASMLNSSIISLVGNRAKDLNIRNKQTRGFNPVHHLTFRLRMYISIRAKDFILAIIADNDMFKEALFEKAIDICAHHHQIIQSEIIRCKFLLQSIRTIRAQVQAHQEEIEFPDEFIDPLTFAPMIDPVILAPSSTRVDRSTAEMILMNDAIDPFTRGPLTEADITADPDLKAKIHAFIKSHQAN
ncbi:ubiquitin conjugation factor E4 B [Nematocida homosporus]|uniref:ubiquitin conjugation factor E4 B n=1 Tax=Nematocida homosporus TaxID=1912981 RepID=UPI00221FDA8F|nr:ubiquitin conjugation factor E4 B [Nematocida homosporus]KAI5184285.1 ubiquitin conjugation factor E4 B [Nematocida homosporus]